MKKSKQLQKLVRKLVEVSFKDGKIVEPQVIKSIKLLKFLSKPQGILVLSEYLKGLKRKMREHTMYIETSVPPSYAQLKKAKKIVEKKAMPAGRQVKITKILVNINPEILGGFKLKIGDQVWDESLLGKINQVKEVISGRSSSSN